MVCWVVSREFKILIDHGGGITGAQSEREDRVSLELTEELVQSMEPGAVFRDYVISSLLLSQNLKLKIVECWFVPSLAQFHPCFARSRFSEDFWIIESFGFCRIAGSARLTFTKLRVTWWRLATMTLFVSMMLQAPREFQNPKHRQIPTWLLLFSMQSESFCGVRCLKTINSKKYGVDLVCFTSHPTTVIYSSRNGWDGEPYSCVRFAFLIIWSDSLTSSSSISG